jgi:hypothetical protein
MRCCVMFYNIFLLCRTTAAAESAGSCGCRTANAVQISKFPLVWSTEDELPFTKKISVAARHYYSPLSAVQQASRPHHPHHELRAAHLHAPRLPGLHWCQLAGNTCGNQEGAQHNKLRWPALQACACCKRAPTRGSPGVHEWTEGRKLNFEHAAHTNGPENHTTWL